MHPELSPIGLKYAQLFDAVDAARTTFDQERWAVLRHLASVAEAALAEARSRPLGVDALKDEFWQEYYLDGEYRHARGSRAGDAQREAGFAFSIAPECLCDPAPPRLAFRTYLFFHLSHRTFAALASAFQQARMEIQALVPGVEPTTGHADAYGYVRVARILPDAKNFTTGSFEELVRALPAAYRRADAIIGAGYAKLKQDRE